MVDGNFNDRSDPSDRSDRNDSVAADTQATFCATLVDEWVRCGVRHAVIAPGSRSTPMAVAMASRSDLTVHVIHDERVAAFVALGIGVEGVPALLLCTSGTAAANFSPAVVEAGLSAVPMIVLTADRPPELRGVGAPQTIDQIELYGSHVRWFHDAAIATSDASGTWRGLAQQTWQHATTGPVQLNLGFREPLLGQAQPLPPEIDPPSEDAVASSIDPVPPSLVTARGVILVGGRSGVGQTAVESLHHVTGWPILADPISGLRHLDGVVTHAESILRHAAFADRQLPDVIVRIGRPSTSKTTAQWVDRAIAERGATLVQVGGPGRIDPSRNVTAQCSIDDVIRLAAGVGRESIWTADWAAAQDAAAAAVTALLVDLDRRGELTEPGVARIVAEHLPLTTSLTVSSSMPVRDHEWFGGRRAAAHANRGANGIDGVMSTALGRCLVRGSGAVLIGDLAFVHDSNALWGLVHRRVDLRVVVVDNDGGGIFSFLPQATELDHDRFEQLFGTPHGTDIGALARAHGLASYDIETADELRAQLGRPGPWVARIRSTRRRNVDVHAAFHAVVADALAAIRHPAREQ